MYRIHTLRSIREWHNIRYIRLTWLDLHNVVRCRVLSLSYFERLLGTANGRPGVSVVGCVLGLVGLRIANGFSAAGNYLYVADLSSMRLCSYAPGHAMLFGWFQNAKFSPERPLEYDLCPRTLLARQVSEASKRGVSFLVGFEIEFILLKSTLPEAEPISTHDWTTTASIYTGTTGAVVLEEIADALQVGGVELQMYHAEAAPGQYEVVTGPLSPLQAADALVYSHEVIYNIASKHKLKATFAPRVFGYSCGSGAHTNVSIHSETFQGETSPKAPTLTPLESVFLQSVLDNLQAICAFSLPTVASYARMADGVWSGGTYVSWGVENREAAVRFCGTPGSHRFEIRCVDGTSNPYLSLASILAAVIHGLDTRKTLSVAGSLDIAATLGKEKRKELGIGERRLPLKLEEARKYLDQSEVLRKGLGDNFVTKYLAVNEILQEHLSADHEATELDKIVAMY
ncbi:glutamine synthetase/guanido kinase [Thelephora ganbajun]|uniref:Glutamine synthetase/guanido kinase n=1 Tax=Thelephora ganbajun TaxID=370292 RepID=A0ACB6ZJN4_THEGA|nr:glutamine synthetase/guanido kinase [Thelephora ganbajun]